MIPDLSHFVGQKCVEVFAPEGGEGGPCWTMVLSGGARIHNYDPTITMPLSVIGWSYILYSLGGPNVQGNYFADMKFAQGTTLQIVQLNPMEYAIGMPGATEVVFPMRSEADLIPRVDNGQES